MPFGKIRSGDYRSLYDNPLFILHEDSQEWERLMIVAGDTP